MSDVSRPRDEKGGNGVPPMLFTALIALLMLPVLIFVFLIMYDAGDEIGIPALPLALAVLWGLGGDHALSWFSGRTGWLSQMSMVLRNRLFNALALAPIFGLCFVAGRGEELPIWLSWTMGMIFVIAVMMVMPLIGIRLWHRIRATWR